MSEEFALIETLRGQMITDLSHFGLTIIPDCIVLDKVCDADSTQGDPFADRWNEDVEDFTQEEIDAVRLIVVKSAVEMQQELRHWHESWGHETWTDTLSRLEQFLYEQTKTKDTASAS